MRIAFCGDVHLGNPKRLGGPSVSGINRRGRHVLDALADAIKIANREGCAALVVLGDLFDTERPTPQLLAATQAALLEFAGDVVLMTGNHDVASASPGDHALGPLAPLVASASAPGLLRGVTVVESPTLLPCLGTYLLLVPYAPPPAGLHLAESVDRLLGRRRPNGAVVLGFHAGISDASTPAYLRESPGSIPAAAVLALLERRKIRAAFAADWHARRVFGDGRLVQVGCLCATGFDNPTIVDDAAENLAYGWMSIYDADAGTQRGVRVSGPRFYRTDGIERLAEFQQMLAVAWPLARDKSRAFWPCYLAAKVEPLRVPEARAILDDLERCGVLVGGEVEVDRAPMRALAEQAARAARGEDTLLRALAQYVERVEVPPGVDRASVLARSRSYLRV